MRRLRAGARRAHILYLLSENPALFNTIQHAKYCTDIKYNTHKVQEKYRHSADTSLHVHPILLRLSPLQIRDCLLTGRLLEDSPHILGTADTVSRRGDGTNR